MRKYASFAAFALVAVLVACGGGGGEDQGAAPADRPAASKAKAKAPAGYQVTAVADGGSISGKVMAAGNVPAPEQVEISKDTAVCGTSKTLEDVSVDASGGRRDGAQPGEAPQSSSVAPRLDTWRTSTLELPAKARARAQISRPTLGESDVT